MYDRNYEDYMRMTLGYNSNFYDVSEDDNIYYIQENQLEQFYPEIYKIIYPMICKACMNTREQVTEELITNITNEIYTNFEDTTTQEENRNIQSKSDIKNNSTYQKSMPHEKLNRNQNFLLKDLIRILVLRELINNSRPGNRPRPPMPPFGRPPIPPPTNRPPIRPRTYNDLYY